MKRRQTKKMEEINTSLKKWQENQEKPNKLFTEINKIVQKLKWETEARKKT